MKVNYFKQNNTFKNSLFYNLLEPNWSAKFQTNIRSDNFLVSTIEYETINSFMINVYYRHVHSLICMSEVSILTALLNVKKI